MGEALASGCSRPAGTPTPWRSRRSTPSAATSWRSGWPACAWCRAPRGGGGRRRAGGGGEARRRRRRARDVAPALPEQHSCSRSRPASASRRSSRRRRTDRWCAMPNMPALVGKGAAAIAAGALADDRHLEGRRAVLGAVGMVVRVPEPARRGHGTSGSGPAYLFLLAEAMIEAGVLVGLPRRDRRRARAPDAARGRDPPQHRRRDPRVAARRGHFARRHHRGGAAGLGEPRGAGGGPRGGRGRGATLTRSRVGAHDPTATLTAPTETARPRLGAPRPERGRSPRERLKSARPGTQHHVRQ